MFKQLLIGCAVALALAACRPPAGAQPTGEATPAAGLPNPASVFCEEQGHTLEIRTDADGNQYGVCVFAQGGECDEWAYFRGECGPEGETTSVRDLETYLNEVSGFAFDYPAGWTVEESPQTINLRRDGALLHITYKRADEIWIEGVHGTGMPEGEFVEAAPVTLLGQSIPKNRLVFEDKTKVVTYGRADGDPVEGLNLVFRLDDVGATSYAEQEVDEALEAEVDQILASFRTLE